jgi:hypothetical protein
MQKIRKADTFSESPPDTVEKFVLLKSFQPFVLGKPAWLSRFPAAFTTASA